jgi:hypothetical protein
VGKGVENSKANRNHSHISTTSLNKMPPLKPADFKFKFFLKKIFVKYCIKFWVTKLINLVHGSFDYGTLGASSSNNNSFASSSIDIIISSMPLSNVDINELYSLTQKIFDNEQEIHHVACFLHAHLIKLVH